MRHRHEYAQPVRVLSSDFACSANMWAYSRLATAPPAEWPVMSSEQLLRAGFSASRDRRRVATGLIIVRATDKKPEWQRLPGSSFRMVSFANVKHMSMVLPRSHGVRLVTSSD